MNKLSTLLISFSLITVTSVNAYAKDDVYPFIAIDYTKPTSFVSQDNNALDFSYAPVFSLGLGTDHNLSPHWSLTNTLSISYSKSDLSLTDQLNQEYGGNTQQLGFWASSRLKRINLFDQVTPFVELSVGLIDADYHYNNHQVQQWQKGYKALAGIEIATGSAATISIGVGYSDVEDDFTMGSIPQ